VHPPWHAVSLDGLQVHAPFEQVASVGQAFPHVPQFFVSSFRSTQSPPHRLAPQVASARAAPPHVPALQVGALVGQSEFDMHSPHASRFAESARAIARPAWHAAVHSVLVAAVCQHDPLGPYAARMAACPAGSIALMQSTYWLHVELGLVAGVGVAGDAHDPPALFVLLDGALFEGDRRTATAPTALLVSQAQLDGANGVRSWSYRGIGEPCLVLQLHLDPDETSLRPGASPEPILFDDATWGAARRLSGAIADDEAHLIRAFIDFVRALERQSIVTPAFVGSALRPTPAAFQGLPTRPSAEADASLASVEKALRRRRTRHAGGAVGTALVVRVSRGAKTGGVAASGAIRRAAGAGRRASLVGRRVAHLAGRACDAQLRRRTVNWGRTVLEVEARVACAERVAAAGAVLSIARAVRALMVDAGAPVRAHHARTVALAAREVVRTGVARARRVHATSRARRRIAHAHAAPERTGLHAAEPIPTVLALLATLAAHVPIGALIAGPIDAAAHAVLRPARAGVQRDATSGGAGRAERTAEAGSAGASTEGQVRTGQALGAEAAAAATARSAPCVAERDARSARVRDARRGAAKARAGAVDASDAVLTARRIEDAGLAAARWIAAPAAARTEDWRRALPNAAVR